MNTQTSLLQLILCVCVCDGLMIGVSRVSLQSFQDPAWALP